MVVNSAPSRSRVWAKARRAARTGAGSGACLSPTDPTATVAKPWTKPGSSASSGMCRVAGVVLTATSGYVSGTHESRRAYFTHQLPSAQRVLLGHLACCSGVQRATEQTGGPAHALAGVAC